MTKNATTKIDGFMTVTVAKAKDACDGTTPVTEDEVVERINRRLARDGMQLVTLQERAAIEEHGEHVVVPVPSVADVIGHGTAGPLGRVERENVEVEKLARELRVLRRGERAVFAGEESVNS